MSFLFPWLFGSAQRGLEFDTVGIKIGGPEH